jgi:hypothetical protein
MEPPAKRPRPFEQSTEEVRKAHIASCIYCNYQMSVQTAHKPTEQHKKMERLMGQVTQTLAQLCTIAKDGFQQLQKEKARVLISSIIVMVQEANITNYTLWTSASIRGHVWYIMMPDRNNNTEQQNRIIREVQQIIEDSTRELRQYSDPKEVSVVKAKISAVKDVISTLESIMKLAGPGRK